MSPYPIGTSIARLESSLRLRTQEPFLSRPNQRMPRPMRPPAFFDVEVRVYVLAHWKPEPVERR
jgi:hypothetical protein